ncbi:hypothetical protein Syun_016668 [Stephania yunnanensis]|uniref:PRA1 family protein n=1 Tax=Stephania yunnanensis TaxID=152371 RepID=A0AAP0P547_9MAGN
MIAATARRRVHASETLREPAGESLKQHLSSTHLPQESRLNPISFSRPASLSDATSRLRKNLSYFRTNYAAVLASDPRLSVLSHPLSLLLLLSPPLAAWLFLYLFRPSDAPLVILGRAFFDRETLARSSSSSSSSSVPEDLFLDDRDGGGGSALGGESGFLSFLDGAPLPLLLHAACDQATHRLRRGV